MKAASFLVAPLVAVLAQSDIPSLLDPAPLPPSTASDSALGAFNPGPTGLLSSIANGVDSALSPAITMPTNTVTGPSGNDVSSNVLTIPSASLLEGILSASITIPTLSPSDSADGAPNSFLLPSLSLVGILPGLPSCTPDSCYSALLAAGPSATAFCNSYLNTATPVPIQRRNGVTTLLKKRVCSPKSLASPNVGLIPSPSATNPADVCTASAQISSVCGCLAVAGQTAATPQPTDLAAGSEAASALGAITMMLSALPSS